MKYLKRITISLSAFLLTLLPLAGASLQRDDNAASKRKIKVEKPDLKAIRNATLDPESPYYFPRLKAKYEINDTTMTSEEFRNFYLLALIHI